MKHNFEVWAWVFMPEHVHLMIFPVAENYSTAAILKSIKQASSRRIISVFAGSKPQILEKLETGQQKTRYRFWQAGSGYDRNYWSTDEILKQIDYIHMNPVRRGLVENPEDWEWSSAGFWLRCKNGPVEMKTDHFPL